MNPAIDPLNKLKETLEQKNSGAICIAENPSVDAQAAALSLYLGLTKLGKNMSIVCATPIKSNLVGSDKIQSALSSSGNNLVISLPYKEGSIDKVDYAIQGENFNLIITPREGAERLNADDVKYSYSGGSVDFVITIDLPSLKSLGAIYSDNQRQFEQAFVINIDRHLTNTYFGKINLVNKAVSSTSEIIFKVLKSLNCPIDKDIATNLYAGLAAATNNFSSYTVNAETFQMASELMRLGASKSSQAPHLKQPSLNHTVSLEKQVIKPIEEVEREATVAGETEEAPEDWLKPKIFRSTNLS